LKPLSSLRLRPTRQKTKNAVANILHNGEVCLEFIKNKKGEERVMDVMRISSDGQRVVVYHPGGRADGVKVTNSPTPIPPGGADAFYSLSTLPEKLVKKYTYAARFIALVKAKTPKITLYTSKAKSYMMESDPGDFETYFYCGVKVTCSSDFNVKFIDSGGRIHNFSYPVPKDVPSHCTLYIEHFTLCLEHCKKIDTILGASLGCVEPPFFPLIIGRKPTQDLKFEQSGNSSLEKENKVPPVQNLQSFKGTLVSNQNFTQNPIKIPQTSNYAAPSVASRANHVFQDGGHKMSLRSDLSRTIKIAGVGVARLLDDGSVQIDYEDSSALLVATKSSSVQYFQPDPGGGGWTTYTHDNLPPSVKGKLALVPQVLEKLMSAPPPHHLGNR